jgi:hypothetical protein
MIPKERYWKREFTKFIDDQIKEIPLSDGTIMQVRPGTYLPMNGRLVEIKEFIHDANNARHYNDLLYSTCYTPYYMFNKATWYVPNHLEIGSEVPCVHCGQAPITTADTMMCPTCECAIGNSDSDDYFVCELCGCRGLAEDGYWVDEVRLCQECADKHTFECQRCGAMTMEEDKKYIASTSEYVCYHCYQDSLSEGEE